MTQESTREPARANQVAASPVDIPEHGAYRRHPQLPPLLYKGAFSASEDGSADPDMIEQVFGQNGWRNGWRDTVFDYEHFHTTAHEVLGCFKGKATLQLGGTNGPTCELAPGDVLLLPAGTAHRKLREWGEFQVVGCYAEGRHYDMQCAGGDQSTIETTIRSLPLPARDPLFGKRGPLLRYTVQR